MKLVFRGHDDRYAVEQSLLAFFPEERPVYQEPEPGEDNWARVDLHQGPVYATAVTEIAHGGRLGRGTSRALLRDVTDEYERERLRQKAVKLSFFKAARSITGLTPAWGALTGIRPGKLAARLLPNPYLRAAVGGVLVILLTVLAGSTDYNGAGMEMVERAVAGEAAPWAWLLKLVFTAVTIGFGFKGGEVVPSFFVGATFGCVAGQALGLPGGFGAAIGLVAVFCGAVNCPIASVLLSLELFGGTDGVLYFAFACAVSYLLSGYCGLYSSQTILYSKLRAEFINVHAKE